MVGGEMWFIKLPLLHNGPIILGMLLLFRRRLWQPRAERKAQCSDRPARPHQRLVSLPCLLFPVRPSHSLRPFLPSPAVRSFTGSPRLQAPNPSLLPQP
ncbi:hypothetical protein VTK26DRAFT_7767 [Humicola hyalothermophila]